MESQFSWGAILKASPDSRHSFLCAYIYLYRCHVDRHHAFRWVLAQSLGKREKTVSNRVINGKSHLAITDLARNNEAVFRLNLVKQGNLRNDQFCLSDHPRSNGVRRIDPSGT
jgi:hypothetical protein